MIHPFLFALYPVLFLFSQNAYEIPPGELIPPSGVVLASAALLFFSLRALLKNKEKAGLVTSLFFILFFSYGYLHFGRHRYFFILWGSLFLALGYFAIRTRKNLTSVTLFLNRVSLILVAFPICFGGYQLARQNLFAKSDLSFPGLTGESLDSRFPGNDKMPFVKHPDIYYIILDGYGRADALQANYGYDNRPFLDHLTQKGFHVIREARSNYGWTPLSLASSLNMSYLDELAKQMGKDSRDQSPLSKMIRENRTARFLRKRGYAFVTFSTGYPNLEVKNSDLFLSSPWTLDRFQNAILRMTPIFFEMEALKGPYWFRRKRLSFTLERLAKIPDRRRGPLFVYAHIVAPHPPFLFNGMGGPVDLKVNSFLDLDPAVRWKFKNEYGEEYARAYREYVVFLNQKMGAIIDTLLSRSAEPPVIILQSDHGPAFLSNLENPDEAALKERMSILNAYYLPGGGDDGLYEGITPVNTFRLILNRYFGTGLEYLKDESYYSPPSAPYRFMDASAAFD